MQLLLLAQAVSELRRLVAGFPLRRSGLEPGSGHEGFVVDEVALGHVLLAPMLDWITI
jgi:hypothetical protein